MDAEQDPRIVWTASSLAIVYSRGGLKGRGRVGPSINFSTRNVADRGLRLVPRAWSMISRHEIRFTVPVPGFYFQALSMDRTYMSRTWWYIRGDKKLSCPVYTETHRLIKYRRGIRITRRIQASLLCRYYRLDVPLSGLSDTGSIIMFNNFAWHLSRLSERDGTVINTMEYQTVPVLPAVKCYHEIPMEPLMNIVPFIIEKHILT